MAELERLGDQVGSFDDHRFEGSNVFKLWPCRDPTFNSVQHLDQGIG